MLPMPPARLLAAWLAGFALLALPAPAPHARAQSTEAIRDLLEGVESIVAPGTPSPLVAWSKDAWIVLGGSAGKRIRAPAVVAGRAGQGRFVALPHNGYFAGEALLHAGTKRFLINATRFTAGGKKKAVVVTRSPELEALLAEAGFAARLAAAGPLAAQLDGVDVLAGFSSEIGADEVDALETFVRKGGGVIAGQCAWGWLQVSGKTTLDDNALQRLYARFGAGWGEGYLGKSGEAGFQAEREPPKLTHGDAAYAYLSTHADPAKVKNEQPMLQAAATLTAIARVLPADDKLLRPKLEAIGSRKAAELDPTPAAPLGKLHGGDRALLAFLLRDVERSAPEEVKALAAARSFPGVVPDGAPRTARTLALDTARPRWHSTGLYAAAGEVVTLEVDDAAARAGLELQVGAHTDLLFDLEEWRRVPRAFVRRPVVARSTRIAAPLGGLVYVIVPDGCELGRIEAKLHGGVEAPWFVLGRDDPAAWRERIRALPAPWAELECDRIVVTVPSEAVRAIEDPSAVLATWSRLADAMADLVAIPRARKSPERYVADVQISAGYMHAGYPIMTHLDAVPAMTQDALLAKGNWGLVHELGHNHQQPEWTFEGTGEVTNNVLCVHALETVCGIAPMDGHEAIRTTAARVADHLQAGAPFEKWKEEPFLALQMYLQVQHAFGWEAYQRAFKEYHSLPRRERPRTDDAKRDLWLVTLSRACNRNLGPFFTAWGIPTSDAARATVADRLAWMPEGFGPPR